MYKETEQKHKEKQTYKDDEIDISVVFDRISSGIKRIIHNISFIISVIIKRSVTITLFVIVGLGLGYGAYKVTKPYYTSSMTLILSDIRNKFVENQLNSLTEMVSEDNYEAIAQSLDIEVEEAKQIKKMEFTNLDQDRISEDSVLIGSPFKIELMLYDNKLFEVMEPALVDYLESNRYFSKQKRIRQRQVESLIGKYKNEIASIDSVKTSVVSPRGPVNGFVYGEPIDPTNLYRESVSMYQQQVQLEAELDRLDNIEIVNGFTPRLNPTGPNLYKFLAIAGFLAFLIGVKVALNLEARKRRRFDF